MEGKVPVNVRRERSKVLHDISALKKELFYRQNYGAEHKALWESDIHEGFMLGFTENYIRVKTPYDESKVNTVENVVVTAENVAME